METASLLNINPKAQRNSASIAGQALAEDLFAHKKTDNFKSAFNHQVKKQSYENTRAEKEKNLPQNGNELPDKKNKKVDIAEHTKSHDTTNNNKQTDHAENDKADAGLEQGSSIKQTDSAEQTNDRNEQTSSSEQEKSTEQKSLHEADNNPESYNNKQFSSDIENTEINPGESIQSTLVSQVNKLDNAESFEKQKDSEQLLQTALVNKPSALGAFNSEHSSLQGSGTQIPDLQSSGTQGSDAQSPALQVPGLQNLASNPVYADKKGQAESVNSQLNSNQTGAPGSLIAEIASRTGADSRNESSMGKNTADFQQYIELSKKQSMSGEPIASVKAFEENLKANLANAQLIPNEVKLPAGQTMPTGQMAPQSVPLERGNPAGNFSPASLTQSLASLEVKPAVGKSGWNQGFSNQIVMMVNNGIQQAKIKLNPMHLGPVEVSVKLTSEGAVVNLAALHLTTKEAMENAVPRLKEMLNENGFSQVDVNVSHQDKKEQQEAALNSRTGSNSEHGNSAMPGDEQLSEVNQDPDSDVKTEDAQDQGLNIVDYYA